MQRHTSELYRLAELPAFIEEALSNVSLKGIIAAYTCDLPSDIHGRITEACLEYAEQWVDDWMKRNPQGMCWRSEDYVDSELKAIEAGVKLFSNPDCKAGLPE